MIKSGPLKDPAGNTLQISPKEASDYKYALEQLCILAMNGHSATPKVNEIEALLKIKTDALVNQAI